jgi:hypothetical protein
MGIALLLASDLYNSNATSMCRFLLDLFRPQTPSIERPHRNDILSEDVAPVISGEPSEVPESNKSHDGEPKFDGKHCGSPWVDEDRIDFQSVNKFRCFLLQILEEPVPSANYPFYRKDKGVATSADRKRQCLVRTGRSPNFLTDPFGFAKEIAFYATLGSKLSHIVGTPDMLSSEKGKILTIEIPSSCRPLSNLSLKPSADGSLEQISYRQFEKIVAKTIRNIEAIHEFGFIHGSLSSRSILVGAINDLTEIRLVDFSNTTPYIDPISGEHLEESFGPSADSETLPSRRTDMVKMAAVLYTLLNTRFKGIHRTAITSNPSTLELMKEFETEMNTLEFLERPDYRKWIDLFEGESIFI